MPLELIIRVDDAGRLNVTGPLHDKVLCYGLLEAARDAVQEHVKANAGLVQPAAALPPGLKP